MEWWTGLPWWIRVPIALTLPVMATVILVSGRTGIAGARSLGVMYAMGFVLLLLGPSDGDKKGYHF